MQEAAPVEVGGAHRGPDAVDQRGLGVQHTATPLVDLHAGAQQPAVVAAPGVEHQPRIGFAWQYQPHIDAPRRRAFQRGQQLRVGREIGVGDLDARLGAADGRQQRGVDDAERLLGRTANGAHHVAPGRSRLGKPVAHLQRVALLLGPDRQKQFLQFGHHRPLQLQVGVAPGQRGRAGGVFLGLGLAFEGAAGVHAADVDAAQKRGLAIDDEEFAVVALVHRPALAQRQRVDRVEFQHPDAAVLHLRKQRRGGEQRAHAVANYIDLHAGALLGDQRGGKALAHFVVVKDVGFHVDVVVRALDGGQHGAVRLGAVAQQAHTVAGGQRAAGHRFFHRQVALKGVAVGRAPGQPFQHCPALRWT